MFSNRISFKHKTKSSCLQVTIPLKAKLNPYFKNDSSPNQPQKFPENTAISHVVSFPFLLLIQENPLDDTHPSRKLSN